MAVILKVGPHEATIREGKVECEDEFLRLFLQLELQGRIVEADDVYPEATFAAEMADLMEGSIVVTEPVTGSLHEQNLASK